MTCPSGLASLRLNPSFIFIGRASAERVPRVIADNVPFAGDANGRDMLPRGPALLWRSPLESHRREPTSASGYTQRLWVTQPISGRDRAVCRSPGVVDDVLGGANAAQDTVRVDQKLTHTISRSSFTHEDSPFALLFCLFSLGPLRLIHAEQPDFGPNVTIFDPSMPTSQIQAAVDAIANKQVDNEFGPQRYALLFMPGTYGRAASPLDFQVGYYTEVAGLGASPTDVTINGHVDVYNRCLTSTNCIALDNFWRSLSNLTIKVMGPSGCRSSADFWAVSRAAPLRRVNITGGNLTLFDYCTAGPQYASGGFISDSQTALSSTVRSSSSSCGTAASVAGPMASGTKSSPGSWARRPSRSPTLLTPRC